MAASSYAPIHVLVFPFPLHGHIVPMFHFAEALAAANSSSFRITFLHTHPNLHRYHTTHQSLPPNLHLLSISDGLPLHFDRSANPAAFFTSLHTHAASALHDLLHSQHLPPFTAIIFDASLSWLQHVANDFNLPRLIFSTDRAAILAFHLHLPRLVSQGHLPPIQEIFTDGDLANATISIPGLPPFPVVDVPLVNPQISPLFSKNRFSMYDGLEEAAGVILNTVYELEKQTIDALQEHCPVPVFPIGPLLSENAFQRDEKRQESPDDARRLWDEADQCVSWLDLHSPQSVLYVSFGSIHKWTSEQVMEVAIGLLAAKSPFLWVIKGDILCDALPEDIHSQIQDLGLAVSWVNQLSVLSHPSVGGFFTHCGWNSTLESMIMGVPMLCCPLFLDQPLNSRLAVDVWKVGIRLGRSGKKVDRKEVEDGVREVMKSEEMRRRATDLRDLIKDGRRGSSTTNLAAVSTKLQTLVSSGERQCAEDGWERQKQQAMTNNSNAFAT